MVVDYILDAFKQRLERNEWIDEFSQQASLKKVNAITRMVAYPNEIFDDAYVNGIYADVSTTD